MSKIIFISPKARESLRKSGATVRVQDGAFTITDRSSTPRLRSERREDAANPVLDPDGRYSDNPPTGPADANERYRRLLADVNKRNRKFWGGPDAA